jgi:hypothetical protein
LNTPAAVAVVFLLLGACVFTAWRTQRFAGRLDLRRLLAVALGLRLMVAVAGRYLVTLPETGRDARRFDELAWSLSREGLWETVAPLFKYDGPGEVFRRLGEGEFFPWCVSLLYTVLGHEPLVPLAIQTIFGAATVWATWAATRELWGERAAWMSGWLAALWPSLILFSAVLLREPEASLGIAVGAWLGVRWEREGRVADLAGAVAALTLASLFHKGAVAALTVLLFACVFRAARLIRGLGPRAVRRSLVCVVAAAATVAMVSDPLTLARYLQVDILNTLAERATYTAPYTPGESSYLIGLVPHSWWDVIWQAPVRMLYFLASPMPWDMHSLRHLPATIEGAVVLAIFAAELLLLRRVVSSRGAWLVAGMLIASVGVFSAGTFNAGTALRHRAKLLPLALMLLPGVMRAPAPRGDLAQ